MSDQQFKNQVFQNENPIEYLKESCKKELTPEQYEQLEPKINQLAEKLKQYEKIQAQKKKKEQDSLRTTLVMGATALAYLGIGSFLIKCGIDARNPIIAFCLHGYGAWIGIVGIGTLIANFGINTSESKEYEKFLTELEKDKDQLLEEVNQTRMRMKNEE